MGEILRWLLEGIIPGLPGGLFTVILVLVIVAVVGSVELALFVAGYALAIMLIGVWYRRSARRLPHTIAFILLAITLLLPVRWAALRAVGEPLGPALAALDKSL